MEILFLLPRCTLVEEKGEIENERNSDFRVLRPYREEAPSYRRRESEPLLPPIRTLRAAAVHPFCNKDRDVRHSEKEKEFNKLRCSSLLEEEFNEFRCSSLLKEEFNKFRCSSLLETRPIRPTMRPHDDGI